METEITRKSIRVLCRKNERSRRRNDIDNDDLWWHGKIFVQISAGNYRSTSVYLFLFAVIVSKRKKKKNTSINVEEKTATAMNNSTVVSTINSTRVRREISGNTRERKTRSRVRCKKFQLTLCCHVGGTRNVFEKLTTRIRSFECPCDRPRFVIQKKKKK